ncbi:MAG TPA: hypothetical protein PK264_24090, partial [Hyphomicrobiaceae bacterium]|nr:hypothetical protein [Hyphomicrobiaceae bacterium]
MLIWPPEQRTAAGGGVITGVGWLLRHWPPTKFGAFGGHRHWPPKLTCPPEQVTGVTHTPPRSNLPEGHEQPVPAEFSTWPPKQVIWAAHTPFLSVLPVGHVQPVPAEFR